MTIKLRVFIFAALSLLIFSSSVFAAISDSSLQSMVPDAGFFVGLGGSYNSIKLDQNVNFAGMSTVTFEDSVLAAGQVQGPVTPFQNIQSTFAPEGQLGYFRHVGNKEWLWGVKFLYQYLGQTSNNANIEVPQASALTPIEDFVDTFTGQVTIGSVQTTVNNEFLLIPFLGYSIKNGYLYLGIGPALFDTQSKFYNVANFTTVNGINFTTTGSNANFSSTQWMWGGALQTGLTYYVDPTWSIDLNYTFAVTQRYTTDYTGSFATTSGGLFTTSGTLSGSSTQRVTTQSFIVSINKVFA